MCTTVAPPTASTVLNCGPALTPVRYAVARACKATRRPTSCFWRLLVTAHTHARARTHVQTQFDAISKGRAREITRSGKHNHTY